MRILQGEDIWTEPCRLLFGQGVVIVWQNATIKRAFYLFDPSMMEVVKDAGINAFPIMNGHNAPPLG
jgi:hypothetical protein